MLDFIELVLDIKRQKKIYISSTHKKQTTICTVENKPNHLYRSMNSVTETRIRDSNATIMPQVKMNS